MIAVIDITPTYYLILASILVLRGTAPEDAWEAIGAARGCLVPDTEEQRRWLARTAPGAPLS